jgi:ferredoxin
MNPIAIPKREWDEGLSQVLSSVDVFAPAENEFNCEYELLHAESIPHIVYNKPKPVTPLKKFFLPVKENVTSIPADGRPRLILGAPNCDVMALKLLDQIYLDAEYADPAYGKRRRNTTLIATDCLSTQDHCHCTSYGIQPVGNDHADLSLVLLEDQVLLTVYSEKGKALLKAMGLEEAPEADEASLSKLEAHRKLIIEELQDRNKNLPDYAHTGNLVASAENASWLKYSSDCVSCGACSAICPTCSCFLLIDQPGFEKVRQLDTCQYPGFERVAGGEDALHSLSERFRNRYMCKYVWKPEKYDHKACTGCGRCIETCIGHINKNELFMELSK